MGSAEKLVGFVNVRVFFGDERRSGVCRSTMTGGLLGLRSGSYGSLQHLQNGAFHPQPQFVGRKPSKMLPSGSREKERLLPYLFRFLSRRRVGMLILVGFAFLVFLSGFSTVSKDAPESNSVSITQHIHHINPYDNGESDQDLPFFFPRIEVKHKDNVDYIPSTVTESGENNAHRPPLPPSTSAVAAVIGYTPPLHHPCENFAFPPPPPPDRKRIGPRPCPVCYIPVEQAIASIPSSSSPSPLLKQLNYVHEENPIKTEPHGGSEFGGYPSLKQRNDSFDIKESMTVHCGFVTGSKPGHHTGFDIDEADLKELEQPHEVIVASAIFGNYDIIQQPRNVSEAARKNVPFYMFIDEETEAYMRNSSVLDSSKRVGLWRIILVHNIPYTDARRNGKIPKLLLHRIFPNVRFSIWIDGKLQLLVDPYQVLERFLWRQNASLAISRHYRRFDVFEEAEANKAAGKYDNVSIDYQIEFYKNEGLTPYSEAKLPITSDVPEGCVIVKEHIPITNLFTCLWFNEVDRFTSRDQLSFAIVRDKITAQVDWNISMFLDCERRNFVYQAYHRDLLEHMAPPPPVVHPPPRDVVIPGNRRGAVIPENVAGRIPARKNPPKRGRGERRSGSRRHRKVGPGFRDNNSI